VKLLLFDIDGTLISTGGAGIRALNRAFLKILAVDGAMEGILPHGKTDPAIIREIFAARQLAPDRSSNGSADTTSLLLDTYLTFLRDEVLQSTSYKVLPGISRFLTEFHGRSDLGMGLATGNVEKGARIKLDRGGLNHYFNFGGFGSDSESRTELVRHAAEEGMRRCGCRVEPHDVFVIGDTPRDIEAGREAGFRSVGVATSRYSVSALNDAGADLAVADFEQGRDQFLRVTRIV
jgi:phosphoglycolate phosphatase-like HAD superfamily hydrolase